MIRRTFLFLPSIGTSSELRLWRNGVQTWDDFIGNDGIPGISRKRKEDLTCRIQEADEYLQNDRTEYFCGLLPSSAQWRLFDRLRKGATYLDIETDGVGPGHVVTVVGIMRDGEMTTLVRGIDLNEENIRKALVGTKILVTFNGSSFDLPMIGHQYPFSVPRVPHMDLRHVCPKAGLHGGLKSVERQIGIDRPQELEYVTGEEAVYLWHLWDKKGNRNALNLLLKYNSEDVRNMEPLADLVYGRMRDGMMREMNAHHE